jgi:type IV secretion system protein VirB3
VLTTELFLLFKSPWVLLAALFFHGGTWVACLREPRIFDIWLVKASRCPRVRTWPIWRCNSYGP